MGGEGETKRLTALFDGSAWAPSPTPPGLPRSKPSRSVPVLNASFWGFHWSGGGERRGGLPCSRDRKTCQYFNHWTEKQARRKLSFQNTFFFLIHIMSRLTCYQLAHRDYLPLGFAFSCHMPSSKQLWPHHAPLSTDSLPASPQDLSKLFALSQLLFMGSDTKDKCSCGILYLGKCHASYIQLSTTMPSALCYLQKADFRGKWTTANQSLLLGKRGEL